LAVTAEASGSTDTDATPLASYRFDFDDGTIVGPQAGASASHTYTQAGTFTVAVTVKDTAGLAATATTTVTVKQNLVGNPGFETNTNRMEHLRLRYRRDPRQGLGRALGQLGRQAHQYEHQQHHLPAQ
jgi:hypothetical protein